MLLDMSLMYMFTDSAILMIKAADEVEELIDDVISRLSTESCANSCANTVSDVEDVEDDAVQESLVDEETANAYLDYLLDEDYDY